MITLSDISLYNIKNDLFYKYNITDCNILYNYIKSGNKEFLKEEFYLIMDKALKLLNSNQDNLFIFNNYTNSNFNIDVLNFTDKNTLGNVLVTLPINSLSKVELLPFNRYNIYELKYLAAHYNIDGKNALKDILYDEKNFNNIIHAINFYDEQILRVASTISDLNNFKDNLFFKDYSLKYDIVSNNINEILNYLFSNSNNFIWGYLNNYQKIIISHTLNSNNFTDKYIINYLNTIITNYITLEEAEDILVRKKVLDRFII